MKAVYLVCSSSVFLMEEEVRKIVSNNPYTTFDLNDVSLDEVLEEAAYVSLFDDKRYIVVRNSMVFGTSKRKKKEDSDEESVSKKDTKLLKYLEQPNDNTVLIFTLYGKCDSKKKVCKIIKDNYELIQIEDKSPKDIVSDAINFMKKDGYKMDTNTAYYIVNNSRNIYRDSEANGPRYSYDLVMNELSKIKLFYGKGCNVLLEDVKEIVGKQLEDSNFDFVETVMSKNIKDAFKMYDDLMIQKVEPILLIAMLAKETRNMIFIKKYIREKSKSELMQLLDYRYSKYFDNTYNNTYAFTEDELEKYLVLLCDMDYKIKTGKISNKLALQMLILEINR